MSWDMNRVSEACGSGLQIVNTFDLQITRFQYDLNQDTV